MPLRARLTFITVGVASLLAALALFPSTTIVGPQVAAAAASCTRYAASNGSDSAPGTAAAPYRTAQKLFDSLAPGQVGCLQPGATFAERLRANRSGTPGNPITLTSGPGAGRATLLGEIYVPDGATDIVYTNLVINGRTAFRVNPSVNGDRITFSNNEVTDEHNGICFHLGKAGEGVAEDIVIDGNWIHDCGRLPATGFDHGIYLNTTRNVRITNNYIYDNADYAVHMYPNAQGTLVANNVMDGNGRGVTFSGEGGTASSNNVVVDNIISNSRDTSNIESYWGGPIGTGNRAERNCLWNGAEGNVGTQRGFSLSANVVADPMYLNRGAKDFRLQPGSPCAGKGPSQAAAPVPAAAPPSPLSTPAKRALRTLRLSMSWLSGRRALVVRARPRVAGRIKIVVRSGRRTLGTCTRRAVPGKVARCKVSARRAVRGRKVIAAARLVPRGGGKGVRVRAAKSYPHKRVIQVRASWRPRSRQMALGVRSRLPGRLTMVARSDGQRLGVCRRTVRKGKAVGCRFRVGSKLRGERVVMAATLKSRSRGALRVRVARTAGS